MKPNLLVLLGAISLSACAQSNSPAVAAQPGALASTSAVANEVVVAPGTPAARARDAVRKQVLHVLGLEERRGVGREEEG